MLLRARSGVQIRVSPVDLDRLESQLAGLLRTEDWSQSHRIAIPEFERADWYNIRWPRGSRLGGVAVGGRFMAVGAALEAWLNATDDDPLERFSPLELRTAARQLGVQVPRGATRQQVKDALYAKASADAAAQRAENREAAGEKGATPYSPKVGTRRDVLDDGGKPLGYMVRERGTSAGRWAVDARGRETWVTFPAERASTDTWGAYRPDGTLLGHASGPVEAEEILRRRGGGPADGARLRLDDGAWAVREGGRWVVHVPPHEDESGTAVEARQVGSASSVDEARRLAAGALPAKRPRPKPPGWVPFVGGPRPPDYTGPKMTVEGKTPRKLTAEERRLEDFYAGRMTKTQLAVALGRRLERGKILDAVRKGRISNDEAAEALERMGLGDETTLRRLAEVGLRDAGNLRIRKVVLAEYAPLAVGIPVRLAWTDGGRIYVNTRPGSRLEMMLDLSGLQWSRSGGAMSFDVADRDKLLPTLSVYQQANNVQEYEDIEVGPDGVKRRVGWVDEMEDAHGATEAWLNSFLAATEATRLATAGNRESLAAHLRRQPTHRLMHMGDAFFGMSFPRDRRWTRQQVLASVLATVLAAPPPIPPDAPRRRTPAAKAVPAGTDPVMTVAKLKAALKAAGLRTTGTKDVLKARYEAMLAAQGITTAPVSETSRAGGSVTRAWTPSGANDPPVELSDEEAGQLLDDALASVNAWRQTQGLEPIEWPDEEGADRAGPVPFARAGRVDVHPGVREVQDPSKWGGLPKHTPLGLAKYVVAARDAAKGAQAHAAVPLHVYPEARPKAQLPDEVVEVFRDYTGDLHDEVNSALRRGESHGAVRVIDDALAGSRLERDVVLYRGVQSLSESPRVGLTWSDPAFLSTTADRGMGLRFAAREGDGVLMRMVVPKGTPAVATSQYIGRHAEAEVLLSRGASFRVVAVHDGEVVPPDRMHPTERVVRVVDVEVTFPDAGDHAEVEPADTEPGRWLADYAERQDSLRARFEVGVKEQRLLGGGQMGETYEVTFTDGTKGILKRAKANRAFPLLPPKLQSDHEELAALVGAAVGMDTMPAVVRIDDDTVLKEYAPGSFGAMYEFDPDLWERLSQTNGDALRLMGFFDVLTQNGDRHAKNWLVHTERGKGKVVSPIDHGNAFGPVTRDQHRDLTPMAEYQNPLMTNPFTLTGKTDHNGQPERAYLADGMSVAELEQIRDRLLELKDDFGRASSGMDIQYRVMMERLAIMLEDARYRERRRERSHGEGLSSHRRTYRPGGGSGDVRRQDVDVHGPGYGVDGAGEEGDGLDGRAGARVPRRLVERGGEHGDALTAGLARGWGRRPRVPRHPGFVKLYPDGEGGAVARWSGTGEWAPLPGRVMPPADSGLMSYDRYEQLYGPPVDSREWRSGGHVCVHARDDIVLYDRMGEGGTAMYRVIADGVTADEADELAGQLDSFSDDADDYDGSTEPAPNGFVDWVRSGDFLVGYTGRGQMAVRKVGDDVNDESTLDDWEGYDLSTDEARSFADALREMADVQRDTDEDMDLEDDVADVMPELGGGWESLPAAEQRIAQIAAAVVPQGVANRDHLVWRVWAHTVAVTLRGQNLAALSDAELAEAVRTAMAELAADAARSVEARWRRDAVAEFLRRFDPDQPRIPSGHRFGGRWVTTFASISDQFGELFDERQVGDGALVSAHDRGRVLYGHNIEGMDEHRLVLANWSPEDAASVMVQLRDMAALGRDGAEDPDDTRGSALPDGTFAAWNPQTGLVELHVRGEDREEFDDERADELADAIDEMADAAVEADADRQEREEAEREEQEEREAAERDAWNDWWDETFDVEDMFTLEVYKANARNPVDRVIIDIPGQRSDIAADEVPALTAGLREMLSRVDDLPEYEPAVDEDGEDIEPDIVDEIQVSPTRLVRLQEDGEILLGTRGERYEYDMPLTGEGVADLADMLDVVYADLVEHRNPLPPSQRRSARARFARARQKYFPARFRHGWIPASPLAVLTPEIVDDEYGEVLDSVEFADGEFRVAARTGGVLVESDSGEDIAVHATPNASAVERWADAIEGEEDYSSRLFAVVRDADGGTARFGDLEVDLTADELVEVAQALRDAQYQVEDAAIVPDEPDIDEPDGDETPIDDDYSAAARAAAGAIVRGLFGGELSPYQRRVLSEFTRARRKPVAFDPDAEDRDRDRRVQDGTPFERPAVERPGSAAKSAPAKKAAARRTKVQGVNSRVVTPSEVKVGDYVRFASETGDTFEGDWLRVTEIEREERRHGGVTYRLSGDRRQGDREWSNAIVAYDDTDIRVADSLAPAGRKSAKKATPAQAPAKAAKTAPDAHAAKRRVSELQAELGERIRDGRPTTAVRKRLRKAMDDAGTPTAANAGGKAPTDAEMMAGYEAAEAARAKRLASQPTGGRPRQQPADEARKAKKATTLQGAIAEQAERDERVRRLREEEDVRQAAEALGKSHTAEELAARQGREPAKKATKAAKATPRKAASARPAAPEGMVRRPFPESATDAASRIAHLRTINTVEQAEDAVASLSRRDLVDIARELSVPGVTGRSVPDLRRQIVETTVGRRLNSIATRGFAGDRPNDPGESAAEFFARTRREAGLPMPGAEVSEATPPAPVPTSPEGMVRLTEGLRGTAERYGIDTSAVTPRKATPAKAVSSPTVDLDAIPDEPGVHAYARDPEGRAVRIAADATGGFELERQERDGSWDSLVSASDPRDLLEPDPDEGDKYGVADLTWYAPSADGSAPAGLGAKRVPAEFRTASTNVPGASLTQPYYGSSSFDVRFDGEMVGDIGYLDGKWYAHLPVLGRNAQSERVKGSPFASRDEAVQAIVDAHFERESARRPGESLADYSQRLQATLQRREQAAEKKATPPRKPPARKAAKSTPPASVETHVAALDAMQSREQAAAYLADVKGQALRDLARRYSVPSYENAAGVRDAIVEATVGSRLDSQAIRQGATLPYGPRADEPSRLDQALAAGLSQAEADQFADSGYATVDEWRAARRAARMRLASKVADEYDARVKELGHPFDDDFDRANDDEWGFQFDTASEIRRSDGDPMRLRDAAADRDLSAARHERDPNRPPAFLGEREEDLRAAAIDRRVAAELRALADRIEREAQPEPASGERSADEGFTRVDQQTADNLLAAFIRGQDVTVHVVDPDDDALEDELADLLADLDDAGIDEMWLIADEETGGGMQRAYVGFKKLSGMLAAKGAKNPDALAAHIGRKKYGKAGFAALAAKGRAKRKATAAARG